MSSATWPNPATPRERALVRLGAVVLAGVQFDLILRVIPERKLQCARFDLIDCTSLQSSWPWVLLMVSLTFAWLSLVRMPPRRWGTVGLVLLVVATFEMVGTWPYFFDCWGS